MTFGEIVDDVCERLNLTSDEAIARVGRRVNRRYRRVRKSIGMNNARRANNAFSVVAGQRDQTIPGEKIHAIKIVDAKKPLDHISYEEMLEVVPGTGNPTCWAEKRTSSDSVIVTFNSTMDDGLDTFVEIDEAGVTLYGDMEPEFAESHHDVLVFGALADELRKKEKTVLARDAELEYERILGEMRLDAAVNARTDFRSGKLGALSARTGSGSAASGAGTGTVTHVSGALTATHLIVGVGGGDIAALADPGTTVQVLHGNPFGVPTWGGVVIADIAGLTAALAAKANLASPNLVGVPTAPTASAFSSSTQIATTAFVTTADALKANLASPVLTGTPSAPTAAPGTSTTQLATTAFVTAVDILKANLASPTFTGNPAAPTPALGDNDTSLATTAFVMQERETVATLVDGATPALDASLGTIFILVAAGNRTIAVPSNPRDGQKIVIRHKASGADRTLALNTGAGGFRFSVDIPSLLATTSAKTDYIGCIYNSTDSKWDVVAVVKGF